MNKKTIKIIGIIFFTIMLIAMSTQVLAAIQPSNVTANESINTSQLSEFSGKIVGALRAIGVVVSVIILMVIGIKYMMGSAEEKAEYKKTMVPYIVGAAILFTASLLAQAIYDFFQ